MPKLTNHDSTVYLTGLICLVWQRGTRRTVFGVVLRQCHTNWLNTRQPLVFCNDQRKTHSDYIP